MRAIQILAAGALSLALAVAPRPVHGQEATPPVFGETVEVRVVNLEVVVTDRGGLPVTGLEASDFRLLVDGAEVPIGFFTEVRGGTAVAPEAVAEEPAVPGAPALAPGEPVGTSYLVFIDELFAVQRDRNQVLSRLRDDLGRLGPEDRMAIVAFDGRKLTMLSSWSGSAAGLDKALRDAMARPTYGLQRMAELRNLQNDQRIFREGVRPSAWPKSRLEAYELAYAQRLQSHMQSAAFAMVGALRSFAEPPGRKVMLLLSGGWPEDAAEYAVGEPLLVDDPSAGLVRGSEIYAPVLATANQLGYTLYPVDVPGLAGPEIDASIAEAPSQVPAGYAYFREHSVHQTLREMARETGGRPLVNAERLDALGAVAADTRSYYWLGFTPAWRGDDRGHEVELEVRREGLRVRSRSGYVDFSRSREVSLRVESGLLLGEAPGAEPLELEVGKPRASGFGRMKVPFTLTLRPEQLFLLPGGDGVPAATVELRVAALDERGGRSEVPVVPVTLR
ncbi:MAG TPA: VWA domain-containing protein, partial [Thermoanaerobaculia bacterium]|nr:VWA domain-containing protein [Thermoanaerobaculia bacterium]